MPDMDYKSDMRTTDDKATMRRCHRALKLAKGADKRWRKRALEGVEFYHGNQWPESDKNKLKAEGREPIVINRIKPTVRLMYGMVVSQPLDWMAKPVGQHDDGTAEAATAGLKQIAAQNNTAMLMAESYRWALMYGVGYVLVGAHVRDTDPRSEVVQHRWIDSREIRVDPMSREQDLSDANWFIWSRKLYKEDVIRMFPKRKKDIEELCDERDSNLGKAESDHADGPVNMTPPVSKWDEYEDWNQADKNEEIDPQTKQMVVHEMWERQQEDAWVLEYVDGTVCEFDPSDPKDIEKLQSELVKGYYQTKLPKVYQHIFAGKILLYSGPSPYKHGRLPLVPVYYDRDEHGDPVSMVESLKDPQREINYRRSKMLFELNNPQMIVHPAIMATMGFDVDGVAEHASSSGAVWVGEPGSVAYLTRNDIAAQQFQLMQDSKQEIQSVSGANDDLLGYDSTSRSGKAKELVMQQGQMQARPAEANYRVAYKLLGELTLQLIQQYHTDAWIVRVTDDIGQDRFVTINGQEYDQETGMPSKINDITKARMQVEVDLMPWTPTLRARSTEFLMNLAHNETDPFVRRSLERAAVMVSDMPEKHKVLQIFDEQAQSAAQQNQQAGAVQQQVEQAKMLKTQAETEKLRHDMMVDEAKLQIETAKAVLPQKPNAGYGGNK